MEKFVRSNIAIERFFDLENGQKNMSMQFMQRDKWYELNILWYEDKWI